MTKIEEVATFIQEANDIGVPKVEVLDRIVSELKVSKKTAYVYYHYASKKVPHTSDVKKSPKKQKKISEVDQFINDVREQRNVNPFSSLGV